MTDDSNFDVDAVMKVVGTVGAKYPRGSPEEEALRIVSVALLYVRDHQKLDEYREYLQQFLTYKPVTLSQTFATRAEADAWLASGTARDGDLVKIADGGVRRGRCAQGVEVRPVAPAGRTGTSRWLQAVTAARSHAGKLPDYC